MLVKEILVGAISQMESVPLTLGKYGFIFV
jgi:hypothetical protein